MEKETSSFEPTSDGVFAIALTLFILGILVPNLAFLFANGILICSLNS
jgi:uncharacterized membrane protein